MKLGWKVILWSVAITAVGVIIQAYPIAMIGGAIASWTTATIAGILIT